MKKFFDCLSINTEMIKWKDRLLKSFIISTDFDLLLSSTEKTEVVRFQSYSTIHYSLVNVYQETSWFLAASTTLNQCDIIKTVDELKRYAAG